MTKDEIKEYGRKWRASHKKQIADYQRKWNAENKERKSACFRKWSENHSEKVAANKRKWSSLNKDKRIAGRKKWIRSNPDKVIAYARQYRIDHKEELSASHKEWLRTHPENRVASDNIRRTRKKGNGGRFTGKEWKALIEKYEYTCLCCGRDDVKLSADHVIPIALGGSSDITNIQPLCLTCNIKKGVRYADYRWGQ